MRIRLPKPRDCSTAKQCRQMGLKVGNTIIGRETNSNGHWNEVKLTLLFAGRDEAVWKVMRRSHDKPRWRSGGEQSNWTLECREWRLSERTAQTTLTTIGAASILDTEVDIDELREKAARWDAIETLMILGDVELTQAEEGGYRIYVEPVENIMATGWGGDTPEQVADKVVAQLTAPSAKV